MTHPSWEGACLCPAAQAQGTGSGERLPCTSGSLSFSPALSLRAHGGQTQSCTAPSTLATDLLQVSPQPSEPGPASSSGPEGGWGWDGVPGSPPPPFPLRCMNIFSAPMGATWPQLLLLRAHQMRTSGKGTMRPQAPAFPRPHPGVCPPPSPPPGRSNQGGRVDSVLQLWPQWGKRG